jgi:hypothetical protein
MPAGTTPSFCLTTATHLQESRTARFARRSIGLCHCGLDLMGNYRLSQAMPSLSLPSKRYGSGASAVKFFCEKSGQL